MAGHFRDFLKVTRNVVVPLTPAPRPIEKATTGMGQGWQIHQLGSQFLNPKSSPHLLSGEENIFVMFILETTDTTNQQSREVLRIIRTQP